MESNIFFTFLYDEHSLPGYKGGEPIQKAILFDTGRSGGYRNIYWYSLEELADKTGTVKFIMKGLLKKKWKIMNMKWRYVYSKVGYSNTCR